jgi:hypothetical protein
MNPAVAFVITLMMWLGQTALAAVDVPDGLLIEVSAPPLRAARRGSGTAVERAARDGMGDGGWELGDATLAVVERGLPRCS